MSGCFATLLASSAVLDTKRKFGGTVAGASDRLALGQERTAVSTRSGRKHHPLNLLASDAEQTLSSYQWMVEL
jgi:hypothetical protein